MDSNEDEQARNCLQTILGINTCGRERKETGLGKKKLVCYAVSVKASTNSTDICEARMAYKKLSELIER
jgi:hypothetical protein